jgi:prephenate dehydratase
MTRKIAFQGEPGAYSHQACHDTRPEMEAFPCKTFEEAIEVVRDGRAELAMLPVENSTYGRVADIHQFLPDSGLHIVATRPMCGCIST